jgi:hypothetical protein
VKVVVERQRSRGDLLDTYALAFLGVIATYLLLPVGPALRIRYIGGRTDAAFVVIFIVARWLPVTDRDKDLAENLFLYAAAVIAMLGIWNYVSPEGWTNWVNSTGLLTYHRVVLHSFSYDPVLKTAFGSTVVTRVGSIFLDPTALGYTMLIGVAISASRLVRRVGTVWNLAAGAVCGICVLLTFTRSAIALLFLLALVVAAGSGRVSRGVGVLTVVAILLVPLASTIGVGAQVGSGLDSSDPRTSAHITALGEATQRLLAQPLGSGLGTIGSVANRFDVEGRLSTSENFYLQVGGEVGLLGAVLFIVLVVALWRHLWRRVRAGPLDMSLSAAASIAVMAIGGIVLHTFANPAAAWPTFLLAGLAIQQQGEEDRAPAAAVSGMVASSR